MICPHCKQRIRLNRKAYDKVIELHRQGVKHGYIAGMLGIHATKVAQYLRRAVEAGDIDRHEVRPYKRRKR